MSHFQRSQSKLQIWLPLLLTAAMVIGVFIGFRLREKTATGDQLWRAAKTGTLQQLLQLVQGKYVDSIATDSLNATAIEAILSKLDPHSIYLPAAELRAANDDIRGSFSGIGVEFQIIEDTVNIIHVFADGPAFKAGLKVGDQIVKAGDSAVAGKGITGDRLRGILLGKAGTPVNVTINRNGKPFAVNIKRGSIPLKSLDAHYLINPTTGYIKLNRFSETTYEEFMEALEDLQQKGMQSLVLDLRDNGGGLLNEAVDIADEFLSENKLIVYTQGAHQPKQSYYCKRDGLFEKGKLALLMDEGSASASEVLAGALQDHDRAIIVGRRSFGKGLVQEQFLLGDGSGLRLTVARYYTPSGRSIQKPYDKGKAAYEEEIMDRLHHANENADSNWQKGKAYSTDNGRKVYGGGGISPDIFVTADSAQLSVETLEIIRSEIFTKSVFQFFKQEGKTLQSFTSLNQFVTNYQPTEAWWILLQENYKKAGKTTPTLTVKDKAFIAKRVKANLGRFVFGAAGAYQVLSFNDPAIAAAVKAVSND